MKRGSALAAVVLAGLLLSGCGRLQDLRARMPGAFGMERAADRLWVERGMPDSTRAVLRLGMPSARTRVARLFGPVRSAPVVIACRTQETAGAFGLRGHNIAHTVTGPTIVLGPHALDPRVLAHEWSHAELMERLRGRPPTLAGYVPRWFDEGLACAVGDESTHSEANWERIARSGHAVPGMRELWTYRQMAAAEAAYGDTTRDHGRNLHVVYTTSAHEVRRWLGCVGTTAVPRLVEALRAGESFTGAYARIEREGPPRGVR